MATFPPTVAQPGSPQGPSGAAPPSAAGGGQGSPAIKLAMLSQAIQGLAKDFPQGQQGIKMMMDGLRQLQGIAATQGGQQQPAAPPL